MTPRQLGDSIGGLYCEGLSALAALLDAANDPETHTADVEALKASLIERFVALGHERQALDDEERTAVDMATTFAIRRVDMAAFQALTTACSTYRVSHNALSNLLAGFNTLHQYAAFELFAQQLPEEAARLGVG